MTKKHVSVLLTLTLMLVSAAAMLAAARTSAPSAVVHNTWSSGAPMPIAVWCSMAGVLNGQIYVVGGQDSNGAVIADTQIYNPSTNTWSAGASLPTPNCAGVGAVVEGVLYIIGGYPYTNAVWAYNPKTRIWSAKAAMPTARTDMGVAVLNNVIYVIGGNTSAQNRINTVESYNPATNTWKGEAPLLVGKSEPSVGLVGNALVGFTIVAADGYTASGETGDNEDYDANTSVWTSLNSDPTPRNAACGGGIGLQMYVAGGYLGSGSALSLNEKFKASKNTWKTLAPMPQAALFGSSAVYKGQLYCIGGTEAFGTTVLNNVQIYQP